MADRAVYAARRGEEATANSVTHDISPKPEQSQQSDSEGC